jgi:hypothetical protein
VVPWWGPARSLPWALALFVAYFALVSHFWGATDADTWAGTPTSAGLMVVAGFCARQKNQPRVRRQALALISGGVVWTAVSFVGVRLLPAAEHAHPGPLRGLVYLIATLIGIYVFTAVTHWRRRETTPPPLPR